MGGTIVIGRPKERLRLSILRHAGKKRYQVKAGDAFMHPPGEAHQLINTDRRDLVFYIIADNPPHDSFHYPDSKKWGTPRPQRFFRISEVDYFDGEE